MNALLTAVKVGVVSNVCMAIALRNIINVSSYYFTAVLASRSFQREFAASDSTAPLGVSDETYALSYTVAPPTFKIKHNWKHGHQSFGPSWDNTGKYSAVTIINFMTSWPNVQQIHNQVYGY